MQWFKCGRSFCYESGFTMLDTMITKLDFHHLNLGWNADPNCPETEVIVVGTTVVVTFRAKAFPLRADGFLVFNNCSSWMLSSINDHAYFLGQCRYGVKAPAERKAPEWGEFYEIVGDDPLAHAGDDWQYLSQPALTDNHYMFYMRDDTFECFADSWSYYQEERLDQIKEKSIKVLGSIFDRLKQVFIQNK
jgi:hypothetical protein